MARNQEKAQSMLNRWVQGKRDDATGPKVRRPRLASEVVNIGECEKWRSQIIRQIAKNVAIIQNAALGEHKIRDLNDTINKLMREKRAWEHQIKALGGNDYLRDGTRVADADGKRAFGTDGYFYFGAARELPGVRDLFDKKNAPSAPKPTRFELTKSVDLDYFGFRDDDDGQLKPLEAKQEAVARAKAVAKFKEKKKADDAARAKALGLDSKTATGSADDDAGQMADDASAAAAAAAATAAGSAGIELLKAHVVLPTEQDLERAVLEKKRKDLLAKYGDASAAGTTAAAPAKMTE